MAETGTLIALAWPETLVVKEGKWYDTPMKWLGFLEDDHYKVGHAALLLISHVTGKVNYFDFGRYHTPIKTGRVRDENTDPDLRVTTKAYYDDQFNIENIDSILTEVANNPSTHGTGEMWASLYNNVNVTLAKEYATSLQDIGAIPYGPFETKGTNCSRFVGQVACEVVSDPITNLSLRLPYTLTHTPKSVVRMLGLRSGQYYRVRENIALTGLKTWFNEHQPILKLSR